MIWFVNLVLFVAACLLSLTVEYFGYHASETIVQSTKEANRVMTNIKISGIAPEEELNYTIESSRLNQNPNDGLGQIEKPFAAHFNRQGYLRTARSDTGTYYEDAKYIVMEGNVNVSVMNGVDLIPVISNTQKMRFNLSHAEDFHLPDIQ